MSGCEGLVKASYHARIIRVGYGYGYRYGYLYKSDMNYGSRYLIKKVV